MNIICISTASDIVSVSVVVGNNMSLLSTPLIPKMNKYVCVIFIYVGFNSLKVRVYVCVCPKNVFVFIYFLVNIIIKP